MTRAGLAEFELDITPSSYALNRVRRQCPAISCSGPNRQATRCTSYAPCLHEVDRNLANQYVTHRRAMSQGWWSPAHAHPIDKQGWTSSHDEHSCGILQQALSEWYVGPVIPQRLIDKSLRHLEVSRLWNMTGCHNSAILKMSRQNLLQESEHRCVLS